jgi:putative lipoprotein
MRRAFHPAPLVFLLLAVLSAMTAPAMAQRQSISGEVTYRERIAMPSSAILRVELVDLGTGLPTRARAEGAIGEGGQVPLSFTLGFDAVTILPGRSYGLAAEIRAGGVARFATPAPVPVDPLAPPPDILLLLQASAQVADPAVVSETPVAEPLPPPPAILDAVWRARRINGVDTQPGIESTLSIAPDLRAGGRGGCNNYFAQASITGQGIRFSAVAATRMACASDAANQQEARFFAALSGARGWQVIDARELVLLGESGVELVRFSRRSL